MDMEKKPVSELNAAAEEPDPSSKEIIASLARQFYGMGWFPGKVMRVESFNNYYHFIQNIIQICYSPGL